MTQSELILRDLKRGDTLTPLDGLRRYGCFRLGARIYDLRQDGWDIITLRDAKKPYARYKLASKRRKAA